MKPTLLLTGFAAPAILIGAFLGCSDDKTGETEAPTDAGSGAEDAPTSKCGKPGDVGNSQGVGKYCQSISECSGNQRATLCSKAGDPLTFFCTKLCSADAAAGTAETQCGENTVCQCGNGGCGCTPKACTESP